MNKRLIIALILNTFSICGTIFSGIYTFFFDKIDNYKAIFFLFFCIGVICTIIYTIIHGKIDKKKKLKTKIMRLKSFNNSAWEGTTSQEVVVPGQNDKKESKDKIYNIKSDLELEFKVKGIKIRGRGLLQVKNVELLEKILKKKLSKEDQVTTMELDGHFINDNIVELQMVN